MNKIIEFINNHKKFIKKIILFAIYVVVVCLINSEPVTKFFYTVFGEYITAGVKLITPFVLISTEV